jgi:hypothetical protein
MLDIKLLGNIPEKQQLPGGRNTQMMNIGLDYAMELLNVCRRKLEFYDLAYGVVLRLEVYDWGDGKEDEVWRYLRDEE